MTDLEIALLIGNVLQAVVITLMYFSITNERKSLEGRKHYYEKLIELEKTRRKT